MKKELQNKLFEKYPKIFRQKDLSIKETAMCWGIDTNDGWYTLIDNLCCHLQFMTDRNNYPQVEAIQVKEKFGSLRLYYQILPKKDDKYFEQHYGYMEGVISFVELLSTTICEKCGSNHNVKQTTGWIYTRCEKCIKELKNE